MRLIVSAFSKGNHNTATAYKILSEELKDFTPIACDTEKINHCIGCNACQRNEQICIHKDCLNGIKDIEDIIIVAPIYFFGLHSSVMKVVERLYCSNLMGVRIHLLLFSGSAGLFSGINVISNQFALIDEYCGSRTSITQIVTNDKVIVTEQMIQNFINKEELK